MHKENKHENKQQKNISHPPEITDGGEDSRIPLTDPPQDQLSDVWRELLGDRGNERLAPTFLGDAPIPTLEVDPWSVLLQANGIEIVDLQRINLQISDQEVEQLLEVMHDEPESPPLGSSEERACKETGLNN